MLTVADETSKFSLICGYCLLPTNAEASVTIGDSEVPLCNDTDITCYELVTVYGRPLADGRRVGRWSNCEGQLTIPYMMENTEEEFQRVMGIAWGGPVPDGSH